LLRQKEKKKKKKRKSFVFKKESFGKKGNVLFYASLRTKRREGVFSPSAQKENFAHIKALLIRQWKDKSILQAYSYLISKELQLRAIF
jgi:hypothetical protein